MCSGAVKSFPYTLFMPPLLAVALGGALGTSLRYGASVLAVRALSVSIVWGTFVVNVVGCFAIGALIAWFAHRTGAGADAEAVRALERWKVFLITGVLGGFTTFSAFAGETMLLAQRGEWGRAGLYVLGTNALCLLAAFAGYKVVTP